jgi:hypothetical protein
VPLWLLALLVVIGLGALAALFVPWRFELSAEARAEPDGFWALAGGLALGPFAVSGAGARGVPPALHWYAFGKRRHSHELEEASEPEEPEEREEPAEAPASEGRPEEPEALPEGARHETGSRVWRFFSRHFDLVDALAWLFSERRRVRLDMDVEVAYSCRDIALTGRIFAVCCLLVPLLPRGVRFHPAPSWDSVDQGTLRASGSVRLFAGLVLWDLFWYMLRRRFAPRRASPQTESE